MRERTQWEAIDLSLAFIKHFAKFIYGGWFLFSLPVAIASNLLLQFTGLHGYGIVTILVFWWIKPLFDRLTLFTSSRLFFRQSPRLKNFFRRPLHYLFKNLLADLTIRRFSPWRSYTMPVRFLEGLKGEKLGKRLKIMTRNGKSASGILTAVCLTFELGLFGGWIFLLLVLTMDTIDLDKLMNFIEPMPLWVTTLQFFFYYISLSLVEPFYVLGGFFLYINRRVYLEGWDIELVFQRLTKRLALRQTHAAVISQTVKNARAGSKALVFIILFVVSSLFGVNNSVFAQINNREADLRATLQETFKTVKEDIKTIMEADEFREWETREKWQWKNKPNLENPEESNAELEIIYEWLGKVATFITRLLPWLLVSAVLIILALFLLKRKEVLFTSARPQSRRTIFTTHPAGHKLKEVVLLRNVRVLAEQAWQRGDYRTALSILYQGALAFLVFVKKMALPESATEGECLDLVRRVVGKELPADKSPATLITDLRELVHGWQRVAYAHRRMDTQTFTGLCERWQVYFSALENSGIAENAAVVDNSPDSATGSVG
jgi:hypothetical protein